MVRTDFLRIVISFLFFSLSTSQFLSAQNFYIVELSDKENRSITAANAAEYLSPAAIERRQKQGITFDQSDVGISASYLSKLQNLGFRVLCKSKWLNTVVLESKDNQTDQRQGELHKLDFVKSVRISQKQAHSSISTFYDLKGNKNEPNAPYISARSASVYDYGQAEKQVKMHNGQVLHNLGFTGKGMTIAVLDAGFNNANNFPVFKRLRNEGRILGTWDFVAGDASVYEDDVHGMMVLSTMAAYLPGELIGTAPDAAYWLLRSEDATAEYLAEEYFWAQAAEFADSVGADVINSSLGYTVFDNPAEDHTYSDLNGNTTPITIAADMAAAKGILVVNSAGNEGNGSWNFISAPADGNEVLAVGAVDSMRNYVSFSGKGPSADGRVKPNVAAQGFSTAIASPWDSVVIRGNGTSFSSPVIAGLAACLWQSQKEKSNIEILQAIERSAHQYQDPDIFMGYGIPDFQKAYAALKGIEYSFVDGGIKVVKAFPNPVQGEMHLLLHAPADGDYKVSVVNSLGQIVMESDKNFCTGLNSMQLNAASWANGYYNIMIRSASSEIYSYPFLVTKQ